MLERVVAQVATGVAQVVEFRQALARGSTLGDQAARQPGQS